ncbi:hypothetical protein GT347_10325 [Xylophilus rhododendri]|uniref:Uncharacterized protein n=1 Tax=Xylophilus rhododendri TaxID=2697032 RepID=A0A857J358_9BURK|nr:hypothetical protein [Xylophilus rhododendri]QHI98354.1 hypothetical protein GT347_10325 [Xylophilus rhododendri]
MPPNVLAPSAGAALSGRAAVVARSRPIGPRGAANAVQGARQDERERLGREIHAHLDSLLVGLRMDLAWLDRSLAEQAGSSADAAQTLRMQMRIRCDGMADQLDRVASQLERIVGDRPASSDGEARS